MTRSLGEIDAKIREEKRLTALESQNEAWAEGAAWGIEPEILAEAALATAFGELARACGDDVALAMLDRMREKVIAGEFEEARTRH
jgi:hypothetical protein